MESTEIKDKKPLLSRDLRILMVSMVLANIGSHMMMPLLAVYLTTLGASITQVGLFFTLSAIFPLFIQILGGWLSDTIGRLKSIALGSLSGVLGYLPYLLFPSFWWLIFAEGLFAIARALVGPSFSAFIAEESEDETRGRTFGSTTMIFLLVQVIGPVFGGFVADSYGFRMMFAISGLLYFFATIIRVAMARRVSKLAVEDSEAQANIAGLKNQLGAITALFLAGGVVTWLLVIDGITDISFRLSFDLMPVYLEQIGGLSLTQIGLLNSLIGVAAMLASPLGGYIADRKEERYAIVLGSLLAAAAFAVFILSDDMVGFAIAWSIFGLTWGLIDPAYQSLISKVVPKRLLGTAYGFLSTSLGLISLPAPYLGGQLWVRFSPQAPFILTMIASLFGAAGAWFKFRIPEDRDREGPSGNLDDLSVDEAAPSPRTMIGP
jgi:DHA1 family multidrug resistance protein-like MFS transporter